jgi:metacaspase-1
MRLSLSHHSSAQPKIPVLFITFSFRSFLFMLSIQIIGFQLPDPNGKKGGACTSAILQVLYERGHEVGKMSWVEVLQDMYTQLQKLGYDQIPQLSSSRWIDVHSPMFIVPPKSGKRRALLIGINYVGHGKPGELSACQNDCENLKDYLIKAQGFAPSEMLILKDDGHHLMPTKKNIFDGFVRLTQYSQPGDVVFVSFSGHGGRVVDTSGDGT